MTTSGGKIVCQFLQVDRVALTRWFTGYDRPPPSTPLLKCFAKDRASGHATVRRAWVGKREMADYEGMPRSGDFAKGSVAVAEKREGGGCVGCLGLPSGMDQFTFVVRPGPTSVLSGYTISKIRLVPT